MTEFVAVFFVSLGTQRRRLRNLNRESRDIRPHKAGARAIYRAQDQAVSRLQDAISESNGPASASAVAASPPRSGAAARRDPERPLALSSSVRRARPSHSRNCERDDQIQAAIVHKVHRTTVTRLLARAA